jgi:hypothetical protein
VEHYVPALQPNVTLKENKKIKNGFKDFDVT